MCFTPETLWPNPRFCLGMRVSGSLSSSHPAESHCQRTDLLSRQTACFTRRRLQVVCVPRRWTTKTWTLCVCQESVRIWHSGLSQISLCQTFGSGLKGSDTCPWPSETSADVSHRGVWRTGIALGGVCFKTRWAVGKLEYMHRVCIPAEIWCCSLFVFLNVKNLINCSWSVSREKLQRTENTLFSRSTCESKGRVFDSGFLFSLHMRILLLHSWSAKTGLHPDIKSSQQWILTTTL